MANLDHLILRTANWTLATRFYVDVMGFTHDGFSGPFLVIRVNEHLTLDLLEEPPAEKLHLAFAMSRACFNQILARVQVLGLPYGGTPFERKGGKPGRTAGARGDADAIYFSDPDGHHLEIRSYDS